MMTCARCPLMINKSAKTFNCCSLFWLDNTKGKRNFSIGSVLRKRSHYDVLGLTPKATQVDVKDAYYKLSKIYHPDKNKGSSDAAEKFRLVNSAYEILGNYKLRRLYDKGIVHTAGAHYRDVEEVTVDVPEDPQTKFYKQHMKRTERPNATGRTPIYNFDEWNNEHYGKAFKRNQEARKRFNDKPIQALRDSNSVKYEILILGGMTLLTVILYAMTKIDTHPDEISHSRKDR